MTDGGGNGTLGAIVQQVEAATACVQAADTAPALRAEAAGFCERVRDTCGAAQLCALAQSATDAKVLGCSITFTGLCKTCQQADKGSASE